MTMGVDKVALHTNSWDLPLAAIFCIAIAAYIILVIVGKNILVQTNQYKIIKKSMWRIFRHTKLIVLVLSVFSVLSGFSLSVV